MGPSVYGCTSTRDKFYFLSVAYGKTTIPLTRTRCIKLSNLPGSWSICTSLKIKTITLIGDISWFATAANENHWLNMHLRPKAFDPRISDNSNEESAALKRIRKEVVWIWVETNWSEGPCSSGKHFSTFSRAFRGKADPISLRKRLATQAVCTGKGDTCLSFYMMMILATICSCSFGFDRWVKGFHLILSGTVLFQSDTASRKASGVSHAVRCATYFGSQLLW